MNTNIEKQEMRNYLLGTLQEDRLIQLEERILCDPEVYKEIVLIEAELIDQYLAGGLSKVEQDQFEAHFLITAERQKNFRFGKLLKRYLDSQPVLVPRQSFPEAVVQPRETAPARSFPFRLGTFGREPALAFSAAIVLLMGIILVCWIVVRRSGQSTVQQGSSHVVVVKLAPGSMRSAGSTARVTVPPKGFDVKLELELANTSFQNYKSQLFRESQPLETQAELKKEMKGNQHIVPLTIAGETLSPGDYQVRLSGVLDSGNDEFIDNYSFRVTAE